MRRRRTLLLHALVLAALMTAMVFVIAGVIPGSGRRLSDVDPGWVVLQVFFELGSLAGYWLLFHRFFSGEPYRLPLRFSAQVGLGELGAFVIVPFGAGGPALRLWALLKAGMPFRVLMQRAVAHDIAFNFPYVATALVLGVAAATGIGFHHVSVELALAPLGVTVVVVAGGLGLLWLGGRVDPARPVNSRLSWLVRESLLAVPAGLRLLRGRARDPLAILMALAYWVGDCGVLWLAFHATGGSAPVLVVALAYMLGQLGNLLPLPGGVGGVEPIVTGVLTACGVGLGLAGAAIILYRLVSLTLQAVAGGLAIASLTTGAGPIRLYPARAGQ